MTAVDFALVVLASFTGTVGGVLFFAQMTKWKVKGIMKKHAYADSLSREDYERFRSKEKTN